MTRGQARALLFWGTTVGLSLAAFQPNGADKPVEPLEQQPIVGGEIDTRDTAVVKLLYQGTLKCSGALVGSRTVLTAAHCSVPSGMESDIAIEVEAGSNAAHTRRVLTQHVHPQWDVQTGAHDLLLLQLTEAVETVTPLLLLPRPLTEEDVGREMRVVGYGASGDSPTGTDTRREVTLWLRRLMPFQLEAGASGKQACAGDSGGPAFMRLRSDGPEYLAATVSGGDPGCRTSGFYARVDIDADWIASTAAPWDSVSSCAGADPDCSSVEDAQIPPGPSCGCWTPTSVLGAAAATLGKRRRRRKSA